MPNKSSSSRDRRHACLHQKPIETETDRKPSCEQCAPVKLGVEVLFEKHLDLIRGKRVGLITNPTGVDSHLDSDIELFPHRIRT